MKLLVLAQVPPPVHGQSIMVRTLVEGLPANGVELHHVNLRLSRDAGDIGSWRPSKLLAVLDACWHAVVARLFHGCDTLYYIPAPGKRGALYRDWVVMLLCRPFYSRLVLHFHNSGLAWWLTNEATAMERRMTQLLLGGADLAIVLDDTLTEDASPLNPNAIEVVPNGIADPRDGPPTLPPVASRGVLFLGQCSEEKGLFVTAAAVLEANRRQPGMSYSLTAAGSFSRPEEKHRFEMLCAAHRGILRYVGPVSGREKETLLENCFCLSLPTCYMHEAQPLVVLEALAAGRPVIATRWRALPAMLPASVGILIDEPSPALLADALDQLSQHPVSAQTCLDHFLRQYTVEQHLNKLQAALGRVAANQPDTRPEKAGKEDDLARTAGDFRVTIVSQFVRALCKSLSVVVLSRLVAPADHGLFALAGTITGLLLLLRDAGLAPAIAQVKYLTKGQHVALFHLHLYLGGALALACAALARPAAVIFHEPRLFGLLTVLGIVFVLLGLGGFHRALLLRELRFSAINRMETTAAVLGTLAMIGAGVLGAGAYSFAVFVLVVEGFNNVAAWRICRWRSSEGADWAGLRDFLRPSLSLSLHNTIGYLLGQLDIFMIGRWYGATVLGPYARASQLLAVPNQHIVTPLSQVSYASLSRTGPDDSVFRNQFRQCVNQIAHLTLPLASLCMVLPGETTRLVLGPNWGAAGPILRWLAANTVVGYLAAGAYPLCVATGRAQRLALISAASLPITAVAIWLGSHYGVAGIAACLAIANWVFLLPRLAWAVHGGPVRLADFGKALVGPLALSAVAALGLASGALAAAASCWQIRFAVALLAGLSAVALLLVLSPQLRRELAQIGPGHGPGLRQ